MWQREFDTKQLLARVSAAQIEAVKLRRAEKVEQSMVDKDLGVLKAFFNWCIDRGLAAQIPCAR
jgi:site-specific recombinase XerD